MGEDKERRGEKEAKDGRKEKEDEEHKLKLVLSPDDSH